MIISSIITLFSRGQNKKFEDMARTKCSRQRPRTILQAESRPLTKFWPQGQLVLEELLSHRGNGVVTAWPVALIQSRTVSNTAKSAVELHNSSYTLRNGYLFCHYHPEQWSAVIPLDVGDGEESMEG